MSQTKILLDTNTYLRLAKSIHPLLGNPFGKDKFTLYIHKYIEVELNRSSRLQNKFYWVETEEYKLNRKKKLYIAKAQQQEIEDTYDHIWEFQKEKKFGLSQEDIYCISTALEMQIPLITDDQDMIRTSKEFGVKVQSTLELLKIMYDNNHIDIDKIVEITKFWEYEKDLPANFNRDFNKYFSKLIKDKS